MDNVISFIKKNKIPFILTVIVIIGFLIRLISINSQDGLWCDEAYSWLVSTQSFPLGILKKLITEDYHPPLYHFILHFWMKLFGDSDIALRMLSVIFSTATIAISYLIGKKLKNETCGLICATLNAFLLFNLIHAQEVRFYTPSITFAALSLYFVVKIFDEEEIKKPLIGLVISNALLIYTLSTGIFFVAIENLVLFVFLICCKKEKIKKFILSQLATFFVCIPQIVFVFFQYLQSIGKSPWKGLSFNSFSIFDYIVQAFAPQNFILFYKFHYPILPIVVTLLLFVTIFIILFKIFCNKQQKFNLIFSIFAVYFLFLFITAYYKIFPLLLHYLGIFMMMFVVIISYLITEYKRATASILFFIVFFSEVYFGIYAHKKFEHQHFYRPYGYKIPATYLKKMGWDKNAVIYMGWGKRLIKYMNDNNGYNLSLIESSISINKIPVNGYLIIISGAKFRKTKGANNNQFASHIYNLANKEKKFKKIFMSEDLKKNEQSKQLGIWNMVVFKRVE